MKKDCKKHLLEFIVTGILTVVLSGMFVGISIILQKAIDLAIAGEVKQAAVLSGLFILVFAVSYWLQVSGVVKLNQKVMQEIREDIVNAILQKNKAEYEQWKATDYISLVQNDVKRLEEEYVDTLFSILASATQLVFAIIVMTHYSWVFTAVMAAMTVLMFLVPAVFSKKMSSATEAVSQAQEKLTEGLSEAVTGYEVAKSFQKEAYCLQKFECCNRSMAKKKKHADLLKQANSGVSNVLAFSMQMVICVLAGWFICNGKLSYGSMVGVIQVSGSIVTPLFQLFALIPAIKALEPIWKKIEEYTKNASGTKNDAKLPAWEEITLKNVSFSYPNEEKDILSGADVSIRRGKKYLIIGESGAGKSTLLNLLCGGYAPGKGNILIDGKPVEPDNTFLRRMTAVVWQNIFLFNESISDNISFGSHNEKRMNEAIENAGIKEMVAELGLDFLVGSNGALLSGGQKQRIAIARALYADKEILVLDEGTSAVDRKNALEIEKNLLKQNSLTLISVSHHVPQEVRKLYDEVIEIKNGSAYQTCV